MLLFEITFLNTGRCKLQPVFLNHENYHFPCRFYLLCACILSMLKWLFGGINTTFLHHFILQSLWMFTNDLICKLTGIASRWAEYLFKESLQHVCANKSVHSDFTQFSRKTVFQCKLFEIQFFSMEYSLCSATLTLGQSVLNTLHYLSQLKKSICLVYHIFRQSHG